MVTGMPRNLRSVAIGANLNTKAAQMREVVGFIVGAH
jgi:hypothetical protein